MSTDSKSSATKSGATKNRVTQSNRKKMSADQNKSKKKPTKSDVSSGDGQSNHSLIARKIKTSANQIWLAGLGAYTKAEEEGGRWFESLVKDGELTRSIVDKQLTQAKEKMGEVKDKVSEVRERAMDSWDRIELAFDDRVSQALRRLNIPTKQDVAELTKQVNHLQTRIKKMEAKLSSAQPKPVKTDTVKKDTSKKTKKSVSVKVADKSATQPGSS